MLFANKSDLCLADESSQLHSDASSLLMPSASKGKTAKKKTKGEEGKLSVDCSLIVMDGRIPNTISKFPVHNIWS